MKLMSTLIALAFLAATPAFAEEAQNPTPPANEPSASQTYDSAAAQPNQAGATGKEERKLEKSNKKTHGEKQQKEEKVEKMDEKR